MKKFTLIFCLFISYYSFSQTSMEEYNYLSKGYLLDKNTGRDFKSGYRMDDSIKPISHTIYNGKDSINRILKVYKFVRIKDDKVVALLVMEKREDVNHEKYYCVPSPLSSTEVQNQASKDFLPKVKNKKDVAFTIAHYYWLALQALADTYTN